MRPRIHQVIEGRQAPEAIEAASFAAIDARGPRGTASRRGSGASCSG